MCIGATIKDSNPHHSQAVLTDENVSLFDFVRAGDTLCQVADIKIKSDLNAEKGKEIVKGNTRIPYYDVIAKLDVLTRNNHPIMPGTKLELATSDEIMGFMLENKDVSNPIHIGRLLQDTDTSFFLGGKFLNNHVAILGMIGTGKSNAGKVILSQASWAKARAIVIDPHGEYQGHVIDLDVENVDWSIDVDPEKVIDRWRDTILKRDSWVIERLEKRIQNNSTDRTMIEYVKFCSDEWIASGDWLRPFLMDSLKVEILLKIITDSIRNFHYDIPLVFNMKGLKREVATEYAAHISDLVLTIGKEGTGSYLFIDEAQTYVPQRGTPSSKTAIIDLITEGRKFECGVVLLSQRPARLDKDVLSQCNSKIILRLTNENDIRQVRASTEFSTKQMFEEVQRLRMGEALMVSSEMSRPIFIAVDKYNGVV